MSSESALDQQLAAAAVKRRRIIDLAILDDSEEDAAAAATGAARKASEFAPGAIFAAARAGSTKQTEPATTTPTSSSNIHATPATDSEASTKPKLPQQQPLPGVVRVPAAAAAPQAPMPPGSRQAGCSLLVSRRQRGNPLLKSIRSVPWEFGETGEADFVLGKTACAVFLSVRYHCLHPDYLHQRLKLLGQRDYDLRVLLLLVDSQEYSDAVRELNRLCLMASMTLILAWSNEEAARYLESYKSLEHKPADSLMERAAEDWPGQLRDVLGCVRGVSKSDAACLAAAFGTFEAIVGASQAELERCPGLGPKKAARLRASFGQRFGTA